MALTGELTDLSLAELIEFFCNQRKTGRLTVAYPQAPAYFYLVSGSVVHASIGELRGIEAVYYALTQSNANFNFSSAYEAPDHTINQPWTSVVLEGLRRMDEGINPRNPFPGMPEPVVAKASEHRAKPPMSLDSVAPPAPEPKPKAVLAEEAVTLPEPTVSAESTESKVIEHGPAVEVMKPSKAPTDQVVNSTKHDVSVVIPSPPRSPAVSDAFLSSTQTASRFSSGSWKLAAIFAALILIVAAVAVPWYARGRAAKGNQAQMPAESPAQASSESAVNSERAPQPADASQSPEEPSAANGNSDAADAAKREREARAREEARLKAKASEATATTAPASSPASSGTSAPSSANNGPKKATVQVTYDENGRVTQATGSDPTALRIARQKRFPPGKAGSATITIPIN